MSERDDRPINDNHLLSMASEFYLGPEPLLCGTPYWWEFFSDDIRLHGVFVKNMGHPDNGPDRWAIKGTFGCLNKLGEWEHESIPSERRDDFYERCRYASAHEAIRYYWRWKKAVEEYALAKFLDAGLDLRTMGERQKYSLEDIRRLTKEKRLVVNYDEISQELLKF